MPPDQLLSSMVEGRGGSLAGLRVIEVGTLIAGPFAGRLLADLGAEVIKVEDPGAPDPLRWWGQPDDRGRRFWWPIAARNKKLITLDLRKGAELFLELVSISDVVLENFRPGRLEKWGLSFERMQRRNPGVILTRVSGYGQTGPYAHRAGYASVAEAMGGLRYINGFPGGPPPRAGISLGDSLAALFAVQGTLAAVYARSESLAGRGQVVDVALTEACFALLESAVPEYDRLKRIREPSGTRLEGIAPSNLFQSCDGKWIVIAANQDTVFRRLCQAMDRTELADDPRFDTHAGRAIHQEEIEAIVASWAARLEAGAITDQLNDAGVVCGPVYTVADIFDDPHFQERDMLVPHDDPDLGTVLGPGIVPKFSSTPGSVRWSGPGTPGAHNDEVYTGLLGLEGDVLERLQREGVI